MRLIDADALIKAFDPEHYFDWCTPNIVETINEQPTVEPVRGEWISSPSGMFLVYRCSECKFATALGKTNFCPNCGSDMRKE